MSVLLLNASYEPLAVVSWRRAMTLMVTGRAELVAQDGDRVVRSAGGAEYPRPQVVRLVQMVQFASMRTPSTPRFSKAGLQVRDRRSCQVADCEERGTTIDHVVPRSRGGDTSWENCVLMCQRHNSRKGDHSLEQLGWTLKTRPVAPAGTIIVSPARREEWAPWVAPAFTSA
jgi:5-methylcytosine-specific restriction endonuclease McrA